MPAPSSPPAHRRGGYLRGGVASKPPLEISRVYIGPDSLMPIASVFAAIAGFFLMFWRRVVGAMRFMLSKFSKKS